MSKVKSLSKIARMITNEGTKAAERKFGKEAVKKTKSKEGEIIKKFKEADRRGFRDASLESGRLVRSKSLRKARDAKRKTESKTQDVFREPRIEEPLQFSKGGLETITSLELKTRKRFILTSKQAQIYCQA